ncbi:MAG: elongation of very long chain fatty acids protein [Clostridiales bacterium]|nr:elongation of very long chain fatty acids protein [Clostridiales bacterium]
MPAKNNNRKNVIWNTIGITMNSFTSLFFMMIINHINGPDFGGIYNFSFSVASLLFVIGIYSTRTFQVSESKGKYNDTEYLIGKVITVALMMISIFVMILIRNYTATKNAILVILVAYKCIEAFCDTLYGYMQKADELYLAGQSLFFKAFLSVAVFLAIDVTTKNVVMASLSTIAVSVIITLLWDFSRSKKHYTRGSVRAKQMREMFMEGFPIFAFSFLSIFVSSAPKFMIDGVLTEAQQNIFGIIAMPATFVSLCGQYIMGPMIVPLTAAVSEARFKDFKTTIYKMVGLLCGAILMIELAAFLLGIPVLNIMYKIDLIEYRAGLLIIIAGAGFFAVSSVLSTALIIMRKNNMQLVIYCISSVLSIILCYFLIRAKEIHGAVIAFAVVMLVHVIMYYLYFVVQYKKLEKQGHL